jgi:hypothetical protein
MIWITPLAGQGLRVSFIVKRERSILKATHSALKALKRL